MPFSEKLLSSEYAPVIQAAWADPFLSVGFLPVLLP